MDVLRRSAGVPALLLPQRAAAPLKRKKTPQVKALHRESGPPKHLVRYLPFVPASLVQETTSFLNDPAKLRALLQLIFSPAERQEPIPEKSRAEYQQALERYQTIRDVHTGFYRRHESAAAAAMWSAIEALPSDLYEEAVQAVTYAPPSSASDTTSKDSSSSSHPAAGASAAGGDITDEEKTIPDAGGGIEAGEGTDGGVSTGAKEMKEKRNGDLFIDKYHFPRALMFHELYKEQILKSLSSFERKKLSVYMNLMHLRYPHAELKRDHPALFWLPEKQVLTRQREGARKGRRAPK